MGYPIPFGMISEKLVPYHQIYHTFPTRNRNYPISKLNPLLPHIDIGIPNPSSSDLITLHHCAAQESIVEKVLMHCNCRDQKTWCSTRRCACVKAEAKCSIACHDGTNHDNTPNYPNISTMITRTQWGYRTRDQDQKAKEAKRQRRNTAASWVASEGNDLATDGCSKKARTGGGRK